MHYPLDSVIHLLNNWGPFFGDHDFFGEMSERMKAFLLLFCFVFFVEKRASARELYCLLEAMDDAQFRTVIVDCAEFCKNQLSADFSPLAQVLQVKNYKITGDYV